MYVVQVEKKKNYIHTNIYIFNLTYNFFFFFFFLQIEDLKKVTSRLSNEHAARKGQYVAPIKIKRSVGIQAAPHIVSKSYLCM